VSVVSSDTRNPYIAMLFVNGAQVAAANWAAGATRVFQSNEAIALGYRQSGNNVTYFEGVLDEVRFWGTALQQQDVMNNMHLYLTGGEQGLVALYRLDDINLPGTILDSSQGAYHGYTLKPLWTLGWPQSLNRTATGVQGVAVSIPLTAVDLNGTPPSGFEFQLQCLPAYGCVFAANDTSMTCATSSNVGTTVYPYGSLMYTADANYTGTDQLCIAARRVNETDFSLPTFVDLNVITAPPSGCLTTFDACGVCGGDGTSCTTGGCDGKGGQFDLCMVCGGDSSTCTCAVYKSYTLAEMDCILFSHEVNRTLVRLEYSMQVLAATLAQLAQYDSSGPLDLMQQLRHICGVRDCVTEYHDEVAVFDDYLDSFLPTAYLCPDTPQPTIYAGQGFNSTAGLPFGPAQTLTYNDTGMM